MQAIIDLFEQKGHNGYIGEAISQWEHASQSAALAIEDQAEAHVVLAAFLHDIGHICHRADQPQMDEFGTLHHERVGADFLRALGASEKVARLVENHVQAKRYLTWRNPEYTAQLSAASLETLAWQGGPMQEEEAKAFEQDPDFQIILKMRSWDEAAKVVGVPILDWAVLAEYWQKSMVAA